MTREQLYGLGFSYEQLKRRLKLGRLHRIHHNVFAVGHPRLTDFRVEHDVRGILADLHHFLGLD